MPKTNGYVKRNTKDGEFSCHISKDVNQMLDLYCRLKKKNKTAVVNAIVRSEMEKVFGELVENVQTKRDI